MREMVFGGLCALGVVAIHAWPMPGQPVASLFPASFEPDDALRAIALAEGRILWQQPGASAAISIGEGENYVAALYGAGAWLVVDARIAKLCFGLAGEQRI